MYPYAILQAMYQQLRLEPYAVHTTFQYAGTEGKRHRLREAMVFYDPPDYYNASGSFSSKCWRSFLHGFPSDKWLVLTTFCVAYIHSVYLNVSVNVLYFLFRASYFQFLVLGRNSYPNKITSLPRLFGTLVFLSSPYLSYLLPNCFSSWNELFLLGNV